MQKKNTKRARMTQRAAVAALLTFAATSAFALGTGRAAGTPLVEPAQKLDAQTCLSCHTTVKKRAQGPQLRLLPHGQGRTHDEALRGEPPDDALRS